MKVLRRTEKGEAPRQEAATTENTGVFERGATQPAGMHRPSNAARLSPRAAITVIARMRGWTGARRIRTLMRAQHVRVSVCIAGRRTVVGCIRRPWRREVCGDGCSNKGFETTADEKSFECRRARV